MTETKTSVQSGFNGAGVAAFESRMAGVMRDNLLRYGARPYVAPSMQEVPLEQNPELFTFGEKLLAGQIDILICMTGVGTRLLIEKLSTRYAPEAIRQALSRVTLVVRGPKPVQALREHGIVPTITIPEPNTWREILEELDFNRKSLDLAGRTVAIQEYGVANEELMRELKKRKAFVIQVPVYRWALPDNRQPLEETIRAIAAGQVQFVLFTSQYQVKNVLRVASELGIEPALRAALRQTVITSVGPVATEVLQENGFGVDFEPSHPKLGHLVSETAAQSAALLLEKQSSGQPVRALHERKIPAAERAQTQQSVFLKACRREPVPYTPVWLMRQAGRYMPEYRRLRNKVPFLELCKNKALCAEVTIDAVEKIKADAAIIFSDLLLIVEPMGLGLEYAKEEGPVISSSVESGLDVERLREVEPAESLAYVFDAIRLTRASLNASIPLIGFAGAPFTLASYIIEGGSSRLFAKTKALMYRDAGVWHALMEKIVRALIKYLQGQVEAGADALQIFDSWVGCLSPSDYRAFVLPHSQRLIAAVRGKVPVIHFGTGTATLLPEMREAGGDVIGVDHRIELDQAWKNLGYDVGIQGNLDPLVLYAKPEYIRERAQKILQQAGGRPGHIFNLGHGVLPDTPVENVCALIDCVHELSQKK